MIKAIIIDDEENCRQALNTRLKKHTADITVKDMAKDIWEGEVMIRKHLPDVIFLDVQMPGGSGFELLEKFPNPSFKVIFVTAYSDFAIKAFKFSALDYLLKPIQPDELVQCIEKLKQANQTNSAESNVKKINVLKINSQNNFNNIQRLVIPLLNGFEVVNVSDIIYCKSESNYTRFYMLSSHEYFVCKSLKEFEDLLSNLSFFRIHNSYLINLNYVKSFIKGKDGSVIMSNGHTLTISRHKKNDFTDFFLNG